MFPLTTHQYARDLQCDRGRAAVERRTWLVPECFLIHPKLLFSTETQIPPSSGCQILAKLLVNGDPRAGSVAEPHWCHRTATIPEGALVFLLLTSKPFFGGGANSCQCVDLKRRTLVVKGGNAVEAGEGLTLPVR